MIGKDDTGSVPARTPLSLANWADQRPWLPPFLLVALLFFAGTAFLFYNQAYNSLPCEPAGCYTYPSDLLPHLAFIPRMVAGEEGLPHFGFHVLVYALSVLLSLELEAASVLVLSAFVVLSFAQVFLILSPYARTGRRLRPLLLAAALLLVTAIYLPWFNPRLYLGQGSPNVWHNPTTLVVRPFALATFLLYAKLFGDTRPAALRPLLIAALLLAGSLFFKPNFAISFIPALLLWVFLNHRLNLRRLAWLSLSFLPAVAVLLMQFAMTYGQSTLGIGFLAVWRIYSPNVPISLLLVLAFPALILVFRRRQLTLKHPLVLAWILLLVTILQYALFYEEGPRYRAGNWRWGYIISLHILFVLSGAELLRWLHEPRAATPGHSYQKTLVLAILLLHLFSGVFYYLRLLTGATYA